ncbi:MAG: protein kinase [Gemmatimonadaceae bacterium]
MPVPLQTAGAEAEQWNRVKAVFLQAVELSMPERAAFLTRACEGQSGLRDEIDSLLASDEAAGGFCETAAAEILGVGPVSDFGLIERLRSGTRLGEYEISAFLSAGGMGEVYRARHTLLDRRVAIKTLNTRAAGHDARRRLIREARHASSLSHPNICTIYEVGVADGIPFIAMQLVDGRTLRDTIHSALPALHQSIEYGIQIADALAHAHDHRIIHRDLKTSNIVVNPNGRPIVLDFGLAKRLPESRDGRLADSTLTGGDKLAGTLSHMAPEVLLGRQADARSDIWSLGVLLYELITGALPFNGATAFETTGAILSEPPKPIPGGIPLAVRLVIERCLVKDPKERYQRAADVRDALESIKRRRSWPLAARLLILARRRTLFAAVGTGLLVIGWVLGGARLREHFGVPPNPRISTLAVLPLENATGDSAADYYAQGFTDELIGQLGNISGIRIIARPSTSHVALTASTRAGIARRLGAEALVEGRLRKSSGRISVEIRLIEASRGRVLWSDSYERSNRQVLALQADLVRALAAEVKLAVRPGAEARVAAARAVNPEAYEAYLKGRYEWSKRTPASLQLAIAHFTKSIELDPTFAPAHAGIADCYNQFGTVLVGTGSPRVFRPLAAAEAIKALQLDPYSAEGHAALGYVRHYDWEWDEAEREFRRAIALNPNYPSAHMWYANLLMSRNRMREALEQVYIARALDPFSLIVNSNVGWILIAANRNADGIVQLKHTLEIDSTYAQARWRLANALMNAGRFSEAKVQAERLVAVTGRAAPMLTLLAVVNFRTGRKDVTRSILAELLRRARTEYVPPASMASIFALLGDTDNQLLWTTRAFEERSNAIAYTKFDSGPWISDRRFQKLLAQSGPK